MISAALELFPVNRELRGSYLVLGLYLHFARRLLPFSTHTFVPNPGTRGRWEILLRRLSKWDYRYRRGRYSLSTSQTFAQLRWMTYRARRRDVRKKQLGKTSTIQQPRTLHRNRSCLGRGSHCTQDSFVRSSGHYISRGCSASFLLKWGSRTVLTIGRPLLGGRSGVDSFRQRRDWLLEYSRVPKDSVRACHEKLE